MPPEGWAGAIGCVGLGMVVLPVLFTNSFSAPPAWLLIAGGVIAVIGLPIGIWGEWRARRAKRSAHAPSSDH